jgi:hypothetical protein
VKSPELPPADQVEDGWSVVAAKLPAGPDGAAAAATKVLADELATGTVAVTVPALVSLCDGNGVVTHSRRCGVVNAHSGKVTKRNREAQSPPYAVRNWP